MQITYDDGAPHRGAPPGSGLKPSGFTERSDVNSREGDSPIRIQQAITRSTIPNTIHNQRHAEYTIARDIDDLISP